MPSCNRQNYPINWNFHRASSKQLITLMPRIYPFFSITLSKISSENGLPGLLPVGQVRRQSYLPKRKIYLSPTTGRGLFLNTNRNQRTNHPSLQSCCSFGMEHFVSIARENNKMNDLHHIDDNFFFCINNDQPVRFSME